MIDLELHSIPMVFIKLLLTSGIVTKNIPGADVTGITLNCAFSKNMNSSKDLQVSRLKYDHVSK